MRLVWVACGIPVVLVGLQVWIWRVNAPHGAEWLLLPALEKSYLGTLTPLDLWRQHNEHRFFFPTAVILALAHWTRWDVTPILLLSLLLAVGIFVLLVRQANSTLRSTGVLGTAWMALPIALIVFSWQQWENWMGQLELSTFLQIFATLQAVEVLVDSPLRGVDIARAAALGVVATYSRGTGVLVWPIGGFLLSARREGCPADRRRRLLLWWGAAVVVALSYLFRYRGPAHHPSVWVFAADPVKYLKYVCAFLGSPLISYDFQAATVAGAMGLFLFIGLGASLARTGSIPRNRLLLHTAVGLYAVGNALLIGIGRAGFGVRQAMASRYVTHSNLLWVALLTFLVLKGCLTPARSPGRWFWMGALVAIILLNLSSTVSARGHFRRNHDKLMMAREIVSASDSRLMRLVSRKPPEILEEGIGFLRRHHLSVFREGGP